MVTTRCAAGSSGYQKVLCISISNPEPMGDCSRLSFFESLRGRRRRDSTSCSTRSRSISGHQPRRDRTHFDEVESAHWRLGKVSVVHEYYYQFGQNEKIVFKLGKA